MSARQLISSTTDGLPSVGLPLAVVLAADVIGLSLAVAHHRSGLRQAVLNGTPLNAPLTFAAVQAAVASVALRARGHPRRVASATLAGSASSASRQGSSTEPTPPRAMTSPQPSAACRPSSWAPPRR